MAGLAHAPTEEKTTLAEDLRALARCPRELWLIYFATFCEFLGVYSFMSTLSFWLSSDYGMTDQQAGWWATAFSVLISAFVFLVGSLADTVGMRRTLLLSFAFAAATRLAMSLAPNGTFAVISLLAFAFAYATNAPVLQAAVQRASDKRTRAFAFSLWYVSFNLAGAVVGPIMDNVREGFLDPATKKLVPHVVSLPVLGPRMMSAHAAIMGFGFVAAVMGVITLFFIRRDFEHRRPEGDEAPEAPQANGASPLQNLRDAFGDRMFWRFIVMLLFLCLVRMMFQHMHYTWPKYVTRLHGDGIKLNTLWSYNAWLILVLAPLGTAVTRRYKPLNVLLFGAFISSLSPFVLVAGSSLHFQIAMIITLTIGEALWSPRLYEYNLSIAPRGRETTYVSLASLPYFLAKFLVTPSSGYLLAAFCPETGPRRPEVLWGIIGITTIVGPLGVLLLRGWIGSRPPEKPAAA